MSVATFLNKPEMWTDDDVMIPQTQDMEAHAVADV